MTKDISKFPFDRGRIASFRRVKAEYKKTCKKAESKSRHILREKLLNFRNDDPKGFWNLIKDMNRWGEKTSDDSETIKPHTWNEYFKKLLNKPISDTPQGTMT